jgi:hypothetical protein
MISRKFNYFLMGFVLFVCGVNAQHGIKDFNQLKKLEGSWVQRTEISQVFENWTIAGDSLLVAVSFQVSGNDTTLRETIKLTLGKNGIVYSPRVIDQNDGKEVDFLLVKPKGERFMFENAEHDFPRQISYSFTSDTTLTVNVSGETDNGFRNIPFYYVRENH